MNALTTIAVTAFLFSVLVAFAALTLMPQEARDRLTAQDKVGFVGIIFGVALIIVATVFSLDLFQVVADQMVLNGLIATWAATVGGLVWSYSFLVALNDAQTAIWLQKRNLAAVTLIITVLIVIFWML